MSFWTEDLSVLMTDFGTTVTAGDRCTFTAIFDSEYVGVGDVEIESSGPALTCRTSDVADRAHGDVLTIDSVGYVIRGIQPDGTGVTLLRLERQ